MNNNMIKSNIFYTTICQYPEEALPNAYRVRPYVNEIIIVHNQLCLPQVKEELDSLGVTLHYVDWKEDFSYKRTQYIRKAGEIIQERGKECGYTKNNTWMMVSDTDEFPSIALLENLQNLIAKAEVNKSTICTINSHDIMIKGKMPNPFTFIPRPIEDISKDEIISHNISNYFKELLVKYQDRLEYKGKVHHTLCGSGLRMMQLPKDYWYDHIKTDMDLHSHGCRNWFIGGGGVQEFSSKWKELRKITDKYGLDSWEKMEKSMQIGNIPSDILQFFIEHRNDNDRHTDSELRSFYSYYKVLHPMELENIDQTVKTVVTEDGIKDPISKAEKEILGIDNDKTENVVRKDKSPQNDLEYYDPSWRKGYEPIQTTQTNENSKLVDIKSNKIYKYQELKISSNSSDSPQIQKVNVDVNKDSESDDEIREFVEDTYNLILGRVGDPGGVDNYVKAIKEKRIKKESLADIFRRSDEYKEKGLET